MRRRRVDWLFDVALEMEPEDVCLAVYDVGVDEGTIAFTHFGIENLKELIEIHKADPSIIERHRKLGWPAAVCAAVLTECVPSQAS